MRRGDAVWRSCLAQALLKWTRTSFILRPRCILAFAQSADSGLKQFGECGVHGYSLLLEGVDSRLPPEMEYRHASSAASSAAAVENASSSKHECKDECAICLQALQPHDRVKVPPCGHTFHSAMPARLVPSLALLPCVQRAVDGGIACWQAASAKPLLSIQMFY